MTRKRAVRAATSTATRFATWCGPKSAERQGQRDAEKITKTCLRALCKELSSDVNGWRKIPQRA